MTITAAQFDTCFSAYIGCALWSSTDLDGNPLDDNCDSDDVNADTLIELSEELRDFINGLSKRDLTAYLETFGYDQLGHDFWLTRNGHGAGFWDRGLGDLGERLSEAARVYGPVDLYVGDDGEVYS